MRYDIPSSLYFIAWELSKTDILYISPHTFMIYESLKHE